MTRYHQVLPCLLAAALAAGGCSHKEEAPPPPPPPSPATNPATASGQTHMEQYYGAPYNTKKIEFFGTIPTSMPTGKEFPLKDFKLISYKTNGETELILTAPDCVVTTAGSRNIAESSGPFHAQTGDGNFSMDGNGFLWVQDETNSTLTISNNVVTTIPKGMLITGALPTNSTPADARSNQFVQVFSDHFFFDRNNNLVTYWGNVRAEDEQLQLRAATVNLHRATNGGIDSLIADTNIVILDKVRGGRATGDRAVYAAGEKGAQLVTLTGNPRWQSGDGLSEGTAKAFVFDRAANTVQAREAAHFRLASTGDSDTGFFLTAQPAASNAPSGSRKFADVDADTITLKLSPTNGPPSEVAANGHVVIVDEAGGSRTTADRATSVPADGSLELVGHAQFQSGERLARAEWLSLNQKTQTVFARTNALVRFPPTALGQAAALRGSAPGRPNRATNGIVGIASDAYDYQNGVLTFHDHVRAAYSEGETTLGTVDCGLLTVVLHSNEVAQIVAEQNVHLHQLPSTDAHGKISESQLDTKRIEIQMRTKDLVDNVQASGGVTATQTQTAPNGGKVTRLGLSANALNARFQPGTNQVESASASGDVRLTDNDTTAQGAKLDYTSSNDTAILTGSPFLTLPGARVSGETGIVYDRLHHVLRVQGRPQTLATVPVNGSNLPGFLAPPGKSPR